MAANPNWSVKRIVVLLMLVIAGIGWLVFSADYARAVEGWKPPVVKAEPGSRGSGKALVDAVLGATSSIENAVRQVPNAPAVVYFSVTKRIWTVVGFLIIESLPIAFGMGLTRLGTELDKPYGSCIPKRHE